ncbi:MAG: hypothetical protein GX762_04165 [Bacteroidales bacterium]|nr:hypothetical protein [Bacteroidales bacterium]
MEFRKLCKDVIGRDNIVALVNDVKDDELKKHEYKEWIDPFRIILYDFGDIFQKDCPLMATHNEGKRSFLEKKSRNLQREEENQSNAHARKKLIAEAKEFTQAKDRENRDRILSTFNKMDINHKLLTIANDQAHLPSYYPIKLIEIDDEELRSLPVATLEIILKKFSMYKKRDWDKFHSRVLAMLSQL